MELPKIGDRLLGKYVLERVLGEGGMGVVFAARHDLLDQRVAVKLIRPDYMAQRDAVTRFLNEARASARIENDHVARVLDVGTLDGPLPYMVLEYLDGTDLGHLLRERRALPVAEAVDYIMEAIEGVAHAHAVGIVHRDLKPSNLFLARRQDGTSRIKVLDFGISKTRNQIGASSAGDVTRTNALLGSPLYMSPEQLRDSKHVDQRSDVWALGVIAFQLLTGKTPFIADNAVALFASITESDPPSLATTRGDAAIPEALELAVLRCLRRKPEDRFESVTELGVALAPHGSVKSVRSLENAERILPRRPTAAADELLAGLGPTPPSVVRPSLPSAPARAPMSTPAPGPAPASMMGQAQTIDHWSKSAGTTSTSKAPFGIAAAFLFVLLLVGGGFAFRGWRAQKTALAATPSASVVAETSAPSAVVSASVPAVSAAPSVEAPAVVATAQPSSAPSATAAVALVVKPKPAVAPPVTPTPVTPPKPAASAAPVAAKNCNPPFWYDDKQTKHFKPECI